MKKLSEIHACAYCGERAYGGVFNQGIRFCNWFCKDWFKDHGKRKAVS